MYAIENCVLMASRHCPNLVLNLNYIQNHNYWKKNIFRGDGCHRTRKGKVEETFPTSRWHRGGREISSKLEELPLEPFLQVEQTFQEKLEEVKRMRLQGETRLVAPPVPEGKQVSLAINTLLP